MKKRVLAMLLALIQCFSLLIIPAHAAEAAVVSVSADKQTVYRGDAVTVTVKLDSNPGMAYWSLDPDYNDEVFEVGTFVKASSCTLNPTIVKRAVFGGYAYNEMYSGDILNITFKVKDNAAYGEYDLGVFLTEAYTVDLDDVAFNITNTKVTVVPKPVSGITLDKTELTVNQGETATLVATVLPEDAGDKTVTWTSSNESVATVADGVVTAVGAGSTTITAKAGEFEATCAVTVAGADVPVTGITLGSAPSAIIAGDEITLTATVTPDYATDKTVTWTTSNEAVATVDANGVVTAVGAGSVTITAAAGEVSATKTFKVYDNLYEVTVDGEAANLTIGKYDNSNTWYRIDVPAGTKTIGISGVGDLRFVNHGNKNPKNGDCPAGMTYEDGVLYMDLDTYTRNDSYMADHYGLTYDKYTQRSLEFWGSNNWKMTCFFVVIEPCEGAHTWVDATCTEPKHCSVCGTIEGEALGHDWEVTTPEVPAVCETPGTTAVESCKRDGCDATQGGTTIAAPGHQWRKVMDTKQPTCDEEGESLYTCTTCPEGNAATKTEPIAALGHTWNEGEVTTQPTCTEKGVKTFHCTVCEDGSKTEEIPANGHNYVDGYCSVCDKMEPVTIPFTKADGSAIHSKFTGIEGLVVDDIRISHWSEWKQGGNYQTQSITIYVDPADKDVATTLTLALKEGQPGSGALIGKTATVQLSNGVGSYSASRMVIGTGGLAARLNLNITFALGYCTGEHEWQDATCETPKTCSTCGKTEGDPLGHDWNAESVCQREGCGASNKITEINLSHPNLKSEAMTMVTGTNEKITVSFNAVDNKVGATQVVAWFSSDETVATVADGVVTALKAGTVTITAKAVDASGIALLADGEEVLAQFTLTVADPAPGYSVAMGADVENALIGSTVNVPVTIGYEGEVAEGEKVYYNAFDLSFAYDPDVLELTSTSIEGMTVDYLDENQQPTGIIHIERYGDDLTAGEAAFTLTFQAIATGDTNVQANAAKVGTSEAALKEDAAKADIIDNITLVNVAGYTVDLPNDFTGVSSIMPGEDYTFTPKNQNYSYTVTAKIGEAEIDVTANDNGSFTIAKENITGNIVITVKEKTGKVFLVTPGEDMDGAESAQYMTDYTATLTKASGSNYRVTVTIGGENYTGFSSVDNGDGTETYTIPGEAITGTIVFDSNKTSQTQDKHSVSFTGTYGDVAADAATEVTNGDSYVLTINKVLGYKYTVTATMGGTATTVTDNGDGTYTVANVTGDLVFTIAKESDLAVDVKSYVTLNGKQMFLVTATASVDTGKVLSYDGNAMFFSKQYADPEVEGDTGKWVYLVLTDGTLSADDAKAKITLTTGEKVELTQTYNVNETPNESVDINDAQLVYDMYNNKYQTIEEVTMQKFLKADVNGDMKIDVNDAVAVVETILKTK